MTYFVTGATGFIGRHLVERLLEPRRPHPRARARGLARQARGADATAGRRPDRIVPVVGDLGEPRLGLSDEQVAELKGNVDHFFHLAAIYDMTADDERNEAINVDGTRHAVELANAARGRPLPPRLLDRRRRHVQGPLPRGHVRRGPEARPPLPPHEVRVRADRPRRRSRARGASTARRSSSATRRPARWTRSTGPTTSSRRIQKLRHALPQWVPLVGPELGYTNIVPVDYVAARDGPHRPPARPRRPGLPPHQPDVPALRRGAQHVRPRRPRAAAGDAHRQAPDRRAAQGRARHADEAAARSRTCARASWPTAGIPDDVLEYVGLTAQFDTRDTERALAGTRHRGARARRLRRRPVGLLGAPPRPGPLQGPLVRGRGERQDGDHHRRLERHRQGGGA